MGGSILAGKNRMALDNGMEMRLLSALEVLEAGREARKIAQEDREMALCANACLLARALETDRRPVFQNGSAVLSGLAVGEIATLAKQWSEFNDQENPGLSLNEESAQRLKKN